MNVHTRHIITVILITAGCCYGQNEPEKPDIYDALDGLWEEMLVWYEEDLPEPDDSDLREDTLGNAFNGYEYQRVVVSDDSLLLTLRLPVYHDLLTCRLSFVMTVDSTSEQNVHYVRPFKIQDNIFIYDDSVAFYTVGDEAVSDSMKDIIGHRFQLYRTLSLPAIFKPEIIGNERLIKL